VIGLPAQLAGPVELATARPADTVPASASCAGGRWYQIKWDGYRIAIVRTAAAARLWSRRGNDLTSVFPDLAAAAEFHLSPGTVLDGEAVVWSDGRLSFDALQKRLTRRSSKTAPQDRPPTTSPSTRSHATARTSAGSPTHLGAPSSNGSPRSGHRRWSCAPAPATATRP
jgi:hypothetical protein